MTAPPVKKACDACHRRKVRCSGGEPCANCSQANLKCTYLAVPQKKGPKGSRAKVISEIRDIQKSNPPAPAAPAATAAAGSRQTLKHGTEPHPFDFNSPPTCPTYTRTPALLSKPTIENCVDFYFTNMSTTAWILSRRTLMDMISARLATDAEVYCLTASLCAFVMVQPGMSLTVALAGHHEGEPPQNRYRYANMLLDDIVRVRKSIDYVESPTLSAVQISFFLFSCYFTLEKQNVCWFHLREAATLAQLMGMHDESSYLVGDPIENTYKRRTYWLILVTERAYAMERHRPLSLHPTIELPTPQSPQEEDVISGFLYLISLFRCIDDEFMALWNKAKSECSSTWLSQLQQQLTDALPSELKTTASQIADVRITLHWLRIMVWQLSITNGSLSSSSPDSAMTFKYPIEVAQDLIQDIQKLSLDAMEVHGVGLIEKLFDIACTLTDVISCVPLAPSTANPKNSPFDYLNKFITLISQLRGGASRYLPLLLAKVSENLPSTAPPQPAHTIDPMQMGIKQGYAGASDNLPTPTPTQYATMSSFWHDPSRPRSSELMFDAYSPSMGDSEANVTPSPLGTPPPGGYPSHGHVFAPVPRSVPVTGKWDGRPG